MSGAEVDFDLTSLFTKNYKIFFYFGFWNPNDNFRYKTLYNVYTFICLCVVALYLLPQGIYMIVNASDLFEVTATLYVACTFFVNLIKTLGVYFHMNTIKQVLMKFKENPLLQVKCPEHLTIAKKAKKLSDYLFYFCSFLGFNTLLFWTLTPFLQKEKTLPIHGWYPYDSTITPNFEITSLFQDVASAFNILHTMNIDSFTMNLMIEVGMQCDFLSVTLENLTKFRTTNGLLRLHKNELNRHQLLFDEEMTKNLKFCIRHYIEVKRIANTLEDIYRTSLVVLFLGGAFILCTIFYQFLFVNIGGIEFFYLMFFLLSMLTEQFIFCWFGSEMTFKSQGIYRAVFNIPSWIDCNLKFRKMLVMFMISLNKPIVIYAGYIIPLSIGVFINVLRTSYSYLTLLKSL